MPNVEWNITKFVESNKVLTSGSVIKRLTHKYYEWTDRYYEWRDRYYEWTDRYYRWTDEYYEWTDEYYE